MTKVNQRQRLKLFHYVLSAETSFCWAFSISTMIRHSLNYFLLDLKRKKLHRFGMEVLGKAIQYLNSLDFHKRLRVGFQRYIIYANGVTVFNIKILQFNEKNGQKK